MRRAALHGMRGRLALCALLLAAGPAAGSEPRVLRPAADDTEIAHDTTLVKGAWRIRDENENGVLRITKDGVTLDLGRAALIGAEDGTEPNRYAGIGIHVVGARGVTIRNGSVRGFKVGIRAENAPGLVITNVDASESFRQRLGSTPEREDPGDWLRPHDNDKGEWESRYGAGISLTDCAGASVSRCRAGRAQNGLLLTRCKECVVHDNDLSFNSGWGIALYRTSRCKVARNRCDWCVRGYSHGVYHRGQDSAGILVFEQSSGNLFVGNSATHGGDGFFLYAGQDTTERTGKGGSNENLVFDNDFSHAVANAIEATFSRENVFVRNDCSDSDHGVWAGYSRETLIGGNKIDGCKTAGISIEHGVENRIVANRITRSPVGIHLWWDRDEGFVDGVFGKHNDTASRRSWIQGNDVLTCGTTIRLADDAETDVRWNVLRALEVHLDVAGRARPGLIAHNLLRGTRSSSSNVPLALRVAAGNPYVLPSDNLRRGHLRGEGDFDPMTLESSMGIVRPPSRLPDTPEAPGEGRTDLPEDMPRGRAEIRIGPWGPLDPRLPHAFPVRQSAPGPAATVHLTGTGAYEVTEVEGAVEVEVRKGTLPATLRVVPHATGAEAHSLRPFRLRIATDAGELAAAGTLLAARWDVAYFAWEADPRRDAAAFAALVAGAPARREQVDALDFPWRTGGPEGLRADRFATVATTTWTLPAGRYRIRTVSDDGVRVRVGGELVIDNWTHHAPTEDVAEVDLPAGAHAVRVEHFEIDGWAHLALRLEAVR